MRRSELESKKIGQHQPTKWSNTLKQFVGKLLYKEQRKKLYSNLE